MSNSRGSAPKHLSPEEWRAKYDKLQAENKALRQSRDELWKYLNKAQVLVTNLKLYDKIEEVLQKALKEKETNE